MPWTVIRGLSIGDAFGDGWIAALQMTCPAEWEELLDATTYQTLIAGEGK